MVRFWVLVQWVMSAGSLNTIDVVCINNKKYGNVEIVIGETILVQSKGALKTRMAKILEVSGDKFQLLRRKRQINTYQKGLQHPARVCDTPPNMVCVPITEQEQVHIPSPIKQVFIDEEDDVLEQNQSANYDRVAYQDPHRGTYIQKHKKQPVYIDETYSNTEEVVSAEKSTGIDEFYVSPTVHSRNLMITHQRQPVYIDEEIVVKSEVNNGRGQLQPVFLDEGSDEENENKSVNYRHSQANTLRDQIDDAGGLDDFLPGKPVYIDDDYIILEQPGVTYSKSKRSRFSQRSAVTFDFQRHHPMITNYFENKEQARLDASELSSLNKHEFTRDLGECNSQPLISPSDLFEEPQTHHAMICSTPMPKSLPNEYNNTHKMNQGQQTDQLQENPETNMIIDEMEKQIHVLRSAFCELSQSTANREIISCFPREVFDKMANLLSTRERLNANATSEAEDLSSGSADESMTSRSTSVVGGTLPARPPRACKVTEFNSLS